MKLSYLALLCATGLLACGNSTSGDDAGGGDAGGNDATTDATSNDGGGGDAATDAGGGDAATDGGLGNGDNCDTQNDQCGAGLICCAGGAIQQDASTAGHCMPRPDSGKCPPIP